MDLTRDYEINGKKSVASIKLSIAHLREYFALTRAIDMTTDKFGHTFYSGNTKLLASEQRYSTQGD